MTPTSSGTPSCWRTTARPLAGSWTSRPGRPTWPQWFCYFGSADVDATVEQVEELGGAVLEPAQDTPYGRLAKVADPTGAVFKLTSLPA